MNKEEQDELRKLSAEMQKSLPWRVLRLRGKFEIQDRDGKPVEATTGSCRFIELATISAISKTEAKKPTVERKEIKEKENTMTGVVDEGNALHRTIIMKEGRSDIY